MGFSKGDRYPLPMVLLALLALTLAWTTVILGDGAPAKAVTSARGVITQRLVDTDTSDTYGDELAGRRGKVWSDRSLITDGRTYDNFSGANGEIRSYETPDAEKIGPFGYGVVFSLMGDGSEGTPVASPLVYEDHISPGFEVVGTPELVLDGSVYGFRPSESQDGVHRVYGIEAKEGDGERWPEGLSSLELVAMVGEAGTTLRLSIPAELLPLWESSDGGTTPLRLVYTVAPVDGLVSEGIDGNGRVDLTTAEDLVTDDPSGNLRLAVGASSTGSATLTFSPMDENGYYHLAQCAPLYRGGLPGSVSGEGHVVDETAIPSKEELEKDRLASLYWLESSAVDGQGDVVRKASLAELEALGYGPSLVHIDGATRAVVDSAGPGTAVAIPQGAWRHGMVEDESVTKGSVGSTGENITGTSTLRQSVRPVQGGGDVAVAVTFGNDGVLLVDGSAEPLEISLPVTVEGDGVRTLSLTPATSNPMDDPVMTRRIPVDAPGTLDLFKDVWFRSPGTYDYVVREELADPSVSGRGFDGSVYGVRVVITRVGEGTRVHLEATLTINRDGSTVSEVTFGADKAKGVWGVVEGSVVSADGAPLPKAVKVTAMDKGTPLPARTEVAVEKDGSFRFGTVDFTEPGRYGYKISQVVEDTPGLTWDKDSQELVIEVTGEKGSLEATVTSGAVVFHNSVGTTDISLKAQQSAGSGETADPLSVEPSQVVSYHFTVSNTGSAPAQAVAVEQVVPTGLEVVDGSLSAGASLEGGTVHWAVGNLNPGESKDLTLKMRVSPSAPKGVIATGARATWTNESTKGEAVESNMLQLEVAAPSTISRSSGILLEAGQGLDEKTFGQEPLVIEGSGTVEYRVRITNMTFLPIQGVTLSAELANGEAVDRGSAFKADGDDGLAWDGVELAPGETKEYRFAASVDSGEGSVATMVSTVSWNEDGGSRNSTSVPLETQVAAEVRDGEEGSCQLLQAFGDGEFTTHTMEVPHGATVSYLLNVEAGTEPLEDAVVQVKVPEGMTIEGIQDPSAMETTADGFQLKLGTIEAGGRRSISFLGKVEGPVGTELQVDGGVVAGDTYLDGGVVAVRLVDIIVVPQTVEDDSTPLALGERLRERFPVLGDESSPVPYLVAGTASILTMVLALGLRRLREN